MNFVNDDLAKKQCLPCSGNVAALDVERKKILLEKLPNWQLSNCFCWLEKEFKFIDFKSALNFVNQVSEIAEAQNHHPNISFTWGLVKISIQTHKINNLVESDFILAAKIDELSN
jgi:4a-hydroxytetrahydrobiopterin dehydratase